MVFARKELHDKTVIELTLVWSLFPFRRFLIYLRGKIKVTHRNISSTLSPITMPTAAVAIAILV